MSERADVVVVGGGIIGSCCAVFLASEGLDVVVVERDMSYELSSTTRSASAIRQQFHLGVNVAMSHFGYRFYTRLAEYLPAGVPTDIGFVERGYLVLAAPEAQQRLAAAHARQVDMGARTILLDVDDLNKRFPWLKTDDIGGATFGTAGEGWFDPKRALEAVRRGAQALGVRYVEDEVTGIGVENGRVSGVSLRLGTKLGSSQVVDAAGTGASVVAGMVADPLPVEGRKRTVFVFRPRETVSHDLTNVVDPTVAGRGLYMRPFDDRDYMAVIAPAAERDPETRDVEPDEYLFDEVIREALARRVHGFEDVEVVRTWAGHYEMNTFDQNAILGQEPTVEGFFYACGLSGHGVMHAPAVGRGIAELIAHGGYRSIDLGCFTVERIRKGEPLDDIQPSEVRTQRAGV